MKQDEIFSPAKINIILKILGKRDDGYHEIQSVMQTIALGDFIRVRITAAGRVITGNRSDIPTDRSNLAWQAAEAFENATGIRSGWEINIRKNIPVAAGLGGGSSNAAAVLSALNRMHGDPVKASELHRIAAGLGSDVPFFLFGGTALAEGRGEIITELESPGIIDIVLINPGFPVSTRRIYGALGDLTSHPGIPNIRHAFSRNSGWSGPVFTIMDNDLEPAVIREFPVIGTIRDWLQENGADKAMVSGSGGTVFGLFTKGDSAWETAEKAKRLFAWSTLSRTRAETERL
ncbi:4-(cytidine 5'-diphospho)-2-C-methyl-D-erythritol kinase [bacterium]|nr:4-(cytidine 5'-diphospho)-2-C-methyl-D-erythritol kinase [candidate division CSSED10-310 bacterium]